MKIGSAFPSDYLKATDLNGKAVRVTIESVTTEKIGDDHKPVLHFIGKDKALVLNKTNANRIVEAVGSDETDDWDGWSVILYPCKVDFQGKRVDAIRIDDRPGSSKPPAPVSRGARKAVPTPDDEDDYGEAASSGDAPAITDDDIPF